MIHIRLATVLLVAPLATALAQKPSREMIGGTLDRCAGIMFDLEPNGDYLAVRFNGTEDNLVLWTFNSGKRSLVERGTENVPLELGTWHEIKIAVHGTQLDGYLLAPI